MPLCLCGHLYQSNGELRQITIRRETKFLFAGGSVKISIPMATPEDLVRTAVEQLGLPYEAIEIDPEFADTVAFCQRYGYPLERSCNTIIVASKKEPKKYVACAVLASTRLDVNKCVTRLMGVSKASFASAEEMMTLTGMRVGGVTPFALPQGLPLYVDERIIHLDWVVLGGGGRGIKIKISPEVFRKLGAEIVPGLARMTIDD